MTGIRAFRETCGRALRPLACAGLILLSGGMLLAEQPGATGTWYEDAPYIGIRDRYEELISASHPEAGTLTEEWNMAAYLCGEEFTRWTNPFDKKGMKGKDQYEKGIALLEHIVRSYPDGEYLVLAAKAQLAGQLINLRSDTAGALKLYMSIFNTPIANVVDGTDPARNEPLAEEQSAAPGSAVDRAMKMFSNKTGAKEARTAFRTPAQKDFEEQIKGPLRQRVIDLCKALGSVETIFFLNDIEARCAETDPELARLATAAAMEAVALELKEMELDSASKR
jgi:hypothetical protein